MGAPQEAFAALSRSVQADSSLVDAQIDLGKLYLLAGDLEKARQQAERAVKQDPDGPEGYLLRSKIAAAEGRPDAAFAEAHKALKRDPAHAEANAVNNLAWQYAERGENLGRAWALAEEARKQMPGDANVLDTLGWVYYKSQSYHKAVGLLKECVQKNPRHPVFQGHLGLAYYRVGKTDAALRALKKSLELDPAHPGADEVRRALAALSGAERKP
ncbi:MAG: hypothetical protein A3F84_14935 [Candidatus Handelsmanbacteria bacterium RIFCSPLOWO2_12_FULL_64_10]|uniref:Uncharacterized protein n=1 Tax=Handelsmanbacteria sp. (strain RIFCSPLOWO2_12_FULL_64_10) TaxID=1817868 RepID=A0A1F6C529_HANXR|nr:MAG: hypothetical protein A3F84_14935 [Candidatus Handelsmanbacteria bacterium RIFCSPLOWO2_12_FULL_64_10]